MKQRKHLTEAQIERLERKIDRKHAERDRQKQRNVRRGEKLIQINAQFR